MNRMGSIWQKLRGLKKAQTLFPENYTDIHSHILPGLDDGSPDIKTSKDLLFEMKKIGITSFVFTPHVMNGVWNNTSERIFERLDKIREEMAHEEQNEFQFQAAAEYMLDDGFSDLLSQNNLLTVTDNFILVEISFMAQPLNLYETIAKIQIAGYRPILAHPERYFYLHGDMRDYERLKNAGCYFQMNLLSLSSWYGQDVKKMAGKLLQRGWYDFMGTDVHHMRHIGKLVDLTTRKNFWENINPLLDIHQQWTEGWGNG